MPSLRIPYRGGDVAGELPWSLRDPLGSCARFHPPQAGSYPRQLNPSFSLKRVYIPKPRTISFAMFGLLIIPAHRFKQHVISLNFTLLLSFLSNHTFLNIKLLHHLKIHIPNFYYIVAQLLRFPSSCLLLFFYIPFPYLLFLSEYSIAQVSIYVNIYLYLFISFLIISLNEALST